VTAVYPGLLGFREVAGLRTRSGGRVRPGLLFRSGTPQFLDEPAARRLIEDTGIRSTIDLRLPHEVAREGRGPLDALGIRHVPRPFTLRGLVSDDSAVAPMDGADPLVDTYLRYLRDGAGAVLGLLRGLAAPDGLPTLVHCTVGKDRTGVAVALVLASVGVCRDDIVAEYAAGAADVVEAMERLRTMASYADAVGVYPRDAWAAPPDVMRRFLEAVDARYGGVPALLEANGVGADVILRLTDLLIDPAPDAR
jgi:protein-tyrosine phosphatase